MLPEKRSLKQILPGEHIQKATHIKLIQGVVKINPHVHVLCPTLAKGEKCVKTGGRVDRGSHKTILRPKLLVKSPNNPSLQLWSCKGCEDKFLLRVQIK